MTKSRIAGHTSKPAGLPQSRPAGVEFMTSEKGELDLLTAQLRSKRSRFITLFHAATKSFTNFSFESEHAYTSASARSSEFDPKIRSARVPCHLTTFVFRSRPSYTPEEPLDKGCHSVLMSRRLVKKSLV